MERDTSGSPTATPPGEKPEADTATDLGLAIVVAVLVFALILGAFLLVPQWQALRNQVLMVLALLPGLSAIVNFLVSESPRYARHSQDVRAWLETLPTEGEGETFRKRFVPLEDARPSFAYIFFGATILTLVFGLVAAHSDPVLGIGAGCAGGPCSVGAASPTSEATPAATVSPTLAPATSTTTLFAAQPQPTTSSSPQPLTAKDQVKALKPGEPRVAGTDGQARRSPTEEGRRGLVYAGYGAFLFVIPLLIGRLHSGGLSGRFLVRLALQSASATVLGFAAGETGAFTTVVGQNQSLFLYLILGLFPAWAGQALRTRAKAILTPDEEGCNVLPICLVDGLDDDTADRLSELGISDIQHLATAEPLSLILKMPYAPNRVLDWIDQALLISYIRREITSCRALGVRGAIDLAVLYGDTAQLLAPSSVDGFALRKARAEKVLELLSAKSDRPRDVLSSIGRALFEDANVKLVWLLWQRQVPA